MFWFVLITLLLFLWTFALLALGSPDLSHYDRPVGDTFKAHPDDAEADEQFLSWLNNAKTNIEQLDGLKTKWAAVLDLADNLSEGLESECEFRTVDANGVPCEWAIAPNADTARRILFLHGGAFLFGSAKGHRKFTDQLSTMANAAVLSVNYRMMPANSRMASTIDAQTAYQWILENGPEGSSKAEWLMTVGDSAGGNLALMLSGWSKDSGHRKPDAVIGFCPNLDSTAGAPSYKANQKTDKLLGPSLGNLAKLPKAISLWFGCLSMRCNPSNPLVSPLLGDLSDLAPTLIHASSSEIMLGDAIRYTNKAKAAGSDVSLQVWENQLHDWHLFNMGIGSGKQAWQEVEKFIQRVS